MNTFEDAQKFGKEGFEALVASATAMTKGYQTIAQEMADFARKAVEHNSATLEKATTARSFERVAEVQQTYAKEAYEAFVANSTKLGEIYQNAAKEAYKPFEASFAAFGVKAPTK
jgi:phasin family protein